MYNVKISSTARPLFFLMVDSADHISPRTGLSPTVTISKNGAAFGSPSGAVSEIANGWYQVAGNATDTNTAGVLLLHATSTNADPVDVAYNIVSLDPDTAALTAAQVATGVWQDATAGDFTVASSIGKTLYINNVVPGGSGGLLISGSNSGTTTLGALSVTGITSFGGATNYTGIVTMADGLVVNRATAGSAVVLTGSAGSGATAGGDGLKLVGGASTTTGGGTAGVGLRVTSGAGSASTNGPGSAVVLAVGSYAGVLGGHGLQISGDDRGISVTGKNKGLYINSSAANSYGVHFNNNSSGEAFYLDTSNGNCMSLNPVTGHALYASGNGTAKSGFYVTNTNGDAVTFLSGGGDGHGLYSLGSGTGSGAKLQSGTGTGSIGLYALSGAGSGTHGAKFESGANAGAGHGFWCFARQLGGGIGNYNQGYTGEGQYNVSSEASGQNNSSTNYQGQYNATTNGTYGQLNEAVTSGTGYGARGYSFGIRAISSAGIGISSEGTTYGLKATASAGTGGYFESTGGNGNGWYSVGQGTGIGLRADGGFTAGSYGMYVDGDAGALFTGSGRYGLAGSGAVNYSGIYGTGYYGIQGATNASGGAGIYGNAPGGYTGSQGIYGYSNASGSASNGLRFSSAGVDAAAMYVEASSGPGVQFVGTTYGLRATASAGPGASFEAGTTGAGLNLAGAGTGSGLDALGGASNPSYGAKFIGTATSGVGLYASGFKGIYAVGAGAGYGAQFDGGSSTGTGLQAVGGAASPGGIGLHAKGGTNSTAFRVQSQGSTGRAAYFDAASANPTVEIAQTTASANALQLTSTGGSASAGLYIYAPTASSYGAYILANGASSYGLSVLSAAAGVDITATAGEGFKTTGSTAGFKATTDSSGGAVGMYLTSQASAAGHGLYTIGSGAAGHGQYNNASASSGSGMLNFSGSGSGLLNQSTSGYGQQNSSGSSIGFYNVSSSGVAVTATNGVWPVSTVLTGAITSASFAAGAIDAAAISADFSDEVADGILNRNLATGTDSGTNTIRTVRQALRVLRNRVSTTGGVLTVYKEDDLTTSFGGAVTTTAGSPITEIDPTG